MPQDVSLSINSRGIGEITFSNLPHNALTGEMLSLLTELINEASSNDQVKVLIIRSAGDRTFCAGANFEELMQVSNKEEGKTFFSGFANVINAIRKCRKLVIGQVQGKTVGGGVGLAAAFDLCYATQFAEIKLSEISIGIGPFVIGPAVRRKIGVSVFSQLSLTPTAFKSSQWAKDKGLFTEVFKDIHLMEIIVNEKAVELSLANPEALSKLKASFWEGCEDWDAVLIDKAKESGQLVLSDFTQKALAKFKNQSTSLKGE